MIGPAVVPFVDLKAQHAALREELEEAVRRVMAGAQFILGPEVEALEQEVAAMCGARHGIGVNSGTDAIYLALLAAGIGPGDEVLVPAFTMFATAEPVCLVGARPVFVDVDPATLTMSPAAAEAKVTRKTKAMLPVHLYGHPADLPALLELAKKRRLRLIEDAAQALGAAAGTRPVGGWGDAGCLSFYPTKNLGGCGDGGMVVTNDDRLAEAARRLRNHGSERKYHHTQIGINSRLDELQAAVLRVKLRHLAGWQARRREHAEGYGRQLAGAAARLPVERAGMRHVYHQYTVRIGGKRRDGVKEALGREGIATEIHYPSPLPFQPALAWLEHRKGEFPESEAAAAEVLSLPVSSELSPSDRDRVADAVAAAVGSPALLSR